MRLNSIARNYFVPSVVRVVQVRRRPIPTLVAVQLESLIDRLRLDADDPPVPEPADTSRTAVVVTERFGTDPPDRSTVADDRDRLVGVSLDYPFEGRERPGTDLLGRLAPGARA